MNQSISKFLKLFSCIICTLLCLYQVNQVCVQYFAYDVNTSVVLRYPTNDTPPAITVCFNSTKHSQNKMMSKSSSKLYQLFNSTPSAIEILMIIGAIEPQTGTMLSPHSPLREFKYRNGTVRKF